MAEVGLIVAMYNQSLRKQKVFRDRLNMLDVLDDQAIVDRYRLTRGLVYELLGEIAEDITFVTRRSHAIPPVIRLLVTLRAYAKGNFLSETGDLHGISRPSTSRCIQRVTTAIIRNFGGEITFPSPPDLANVKDNFYQMGNFPNVVGVIDGTLIPIIAPSMDEQSYVCRKGYHALNIQAISDSKFRFLNVVARWPGAVHDSFILNNSGISTVFERGDIDGWLLGDSGYPLRPWLMTPVPAPATPAEERYNKSHKKTRNVVERAFGILKSRFRCLHKSSGHLMSRPERCCRIVQACFILHNMCLVRNVPVLDDITFEDEDHGTDHVYAGVLNDGVAARQNLIANRF